MIPERTIATATLWGAEVEPRDGLAERHRQRVEAARQNWIEYPASDLERRGPYIVDRPSGVLFRGVPFEPMGFDGSVIADGPDRVDAFYQDSTNNTIVWLQRVRQGPTTVAELHAAEQAEEERRRAEQEAAAVAEAKRLRQLATQPRRPITLADIEGRELPTLRQAAATIAAVHGRVEAKDGHVRVSIPEGLEDPAPAITAARVLVAAGELVLEALESKPNQPLAALLPDRPVLAGGGA